MKAAGTADGYRDLAEAIARHGVGPRRRAGAPAARRGETRFGEIVDRYHEAADREPAGQVGRSGSSASASLFVAPLRRRWPVRSGRRGARALRDDGGDLRAGPRGARAEAGAVREGPRAGPRGAAGRLAHGAGGGRRGGRRAVRARVAGGLDCAGGRGGAVRGRVRRGDRRRRSTATGPDRWPRPASSSARCERRGVSELSIREFACRAGGERWDELFEALFGLEETRRAASAWGDAHPARFRLGAWRLPRARLARRPAPRPSRGPRRATVRAWRRRPWSRRRSTR